MNFGYQVIIYRHGDSFEALQDIIGYRFKNMSLLIQAVTHKSYKEHFNTMKEH
jgi:dsRNA-specific ribonuclease